MTYARTNHDSQYWLDGNTGDPVNSRYNDSKWWNNKRPYAYPQTIEILSTPAGGGNGTRYTDEDIRWLLDLNIRFGNGYFEGMEEPPLFRYAAGLFNTADNPYPAGSYVQLGHNPKAQSITTGSGKTQSGMMLENFVKIIGPKKNGAYPIETLASLPDLDKVNPITHRWLFCLGTSIDKDGFVGYAPDGYPIITWWPLWTKETTAWIRAEKLTVGVQLPEEPQMPRTEKNLDLGKGIWIWQLREVIPGTSGTPIYSSIAEFADDVKARGFRHVVIKVADGMWAYQASVDLPAVVNALKIRDIIVLGYQYVFQTWEGLSYKGTAIQQADKGIDLVNLLGLDGLIENAEHQMKGQPAFALTYSSRVSVGLPDKILGLSTYRYPEYHPTFPYSEFLRNVDVNMPQVYWLGSTNPAEQLEECLSQYEMFESVPIQPIGLAFGEHGYPPPTPEQVNEFYKAVKFNGLQGFSYWRYRTAFDNGLLATITAQESIETPPVPPTTPPSEVDVQAILDSVQAIRGAADAIEQELT